MIKPENIEPTTEKSTMLNIPWTFYLSMLDIMSGFIMLAKGLLVLVFVKYPVVSLQKYDFLNLTESSGKNSQFFLTLVLLAKALLYSVILYGYSYLSLISSLTSSNALEISNYLSMGSLARSAYFSNILFLRTLKFMLAF